METDRPPPAARRRAAVAAGIGGLAVLAAACGSQHATGHAGTPARPAATSLVISVITAHGAAPRRWTLTCGPAGGPRPGAQAACAALASVKHPFAPVAAGVMCPMTASGPQSATITGTWHGQQVSASYSRTHDCQPELWNKLEKALGLVNPGGPMVPASGSPPAG